MDIEIPDKTYFRIGEVSKILGVEPYVVRYWETEFKTVKPIRTKSEQRLYRRKDLEELALIRKLLYRDRFTIAGAKKKTPGTSKESPVVSADDEECREKLRSIKAGVEGHPGSVELRRKESIRRRSSGRGTRQGIQKSLQKSRSARNIPCGPAFFAYATGCGRDRRRAGVISLRLSWKP